PAGEDPGKAGVLTPVTTARPGDGDGQSTGHFAAGLEGDGDRGAYSQATQKLEVIGVMGELAQVLLRHPLVEARLQRGTAAAVHHARRSRGHAFGETLLELGPAAPR